MRLENRLERLGKAPIHCGYMFVAPLIASLFLTTPLLASDGRAINFGVERDLSDGAFALLVGNFDEGIRLTQQGLEAPPHTRARSGAFSNLCAGYVGIGDYQRAVEHCTSAIELDETNWHAYNNRGYAYLKMGDLTAAQDDIDRGLKLKPHAPILMQVKRLIAQR